MPELIQDDGRRAANGEAATRDVLLLGALAVGIALRVWQFAGGAALFIDEVGVARNIAERSVGELLRPLDYGQVAPPGFLVVERLVWSVFHSDWSLRLVPFAASIASLLLLAVLARRLIDANAARVVVAALAVGVPFVRYGAWVKQYSSDVAVALAILLLAWQVQTGVRNRRHLLVGLAGFLAVWLSSSAVFVVAGAGVALLVLALAGQVPERRRVALGVIAPWVIGAAAAAIASRRAVGADTMAYMKEYWRSGFAPWPPWTRHDLTWPWHAMVNVFGTTGLGYRFAEAFVVLALLGLVTLWRRRRPAAVLLLGPVVVTLGASVAHVYPFEDRLILFLTPIFLLAVAVGASALVTWSRSSFRWAGVVIPLAVLAPPVERIVAEHPVYRVVDPRPLLASLGAQRHSGDVVFLWHRAVPFLAWYGPRFGLTAVDTVAGGCWWAEPARFVQDLDRVRGRPRVWLIPGWGGSDASAALVRYADTIGIRRERAGGRPEDGLAISGWLYDFSDSTRLRRASADDFPVPASPVAKAMIMNCAMAYGGRRASATLPSGRR